MSAAVEDNSKVPRALDDLDGSRRQRDVVDVDMLQLLARAEPHDLGLGRVQPQSAGSHPFADKESFSIVKLGVNNGSYNGGGCFGIEVWTDTANLTNMVIAGFGER